MVTAFIWGTGYYAERLGIGLAGTNVTVEGYVNYIPPDIPPDTHDADDEAFIPDPLPDPARLDALVIEPGELPGYSFDYVVVADQNPDIALIAISGLGIAPEKILVADWHRITLQLLARSVPGHGLSIRSVPALEPRTWRHKFAVLPGVITPGETPLCQALLADDYLGELRGKRVLFLSPGDGAYAFDLETRGAQVVTLDIAPVDSCAFEFAKKLRRSQIRSVCDNPENITPEAYGLFDAVCLYDLPLRQADPLLTLRALSGVLEAGGTLYFAGGFLEDLQHMDPYLTRFSTQLEKLGELPLAFHSPAVLGTKELAPHPIPNATCFRDWLEASGFTLEMRQADEQAGMTIGKATKTRAIDRIAPQTGHMPRRQRSRTLVAVVGFPRSGTTFLQHTLADTPGFGGASSEQSIDIYSYILYKLSRLTIHKSIDLHFSSQHGLLSACNAQAHFSREVLSTITELAQGVWKDIRTLGVDFIDNIALANLKPQDDFFVAKRPVMQFNLPKYLEYYCQRSRLFGQMHYVITIRHPLETWTSGCLKFSNWPKEQWFIDEIINNWLAFVQDAMDHGGIFVDYRKLEDTPQAVLDRVAAAIGAKQIKSLQFRQSSFTSVDLRASQAQLTRIEALWRQIPFIL